MFEKLVCRGRSDTPLVQLGVNLNPMYFVSFGMGVFSYFFVLQFSFHADPSLDSLFFLKP